MAFPCCKGPCIFGLSSLPVQVLASGQFLTTKMHEVILKLPWFVRKATISGSLFLIHTKRSFWLMLTPMVLHGLLDVLHFISGKYLLYIWLVLYMVGQRYCLPLQSLFLLFTAIFFKEVKKWALKSLLTDEITKLCGIPLSFLSVYWGNNGISKTLASFCSLFHFCLEKLGEKKSVAFVF